MFIKVTQVTGSDSVTLLLKGVQKSKAMKNFMKNELLEFDIGFITEIPIQWRKVDKEIVSV